MRTFGDLCIPGGSPVTPSNIVFPFELAASLEDEVRVWEEERGRLVWFRRTAGLDPVAYLEGVAEVIGRSGISSINTSDRSQIQIFVKSADATKLLFGSGIRVGGVRYKAYRAEEKPLRIFVEDVPPCVPNRVIAKAFEAYGGCLPSDVECVSLGGKDAGFARIMTCRRVVWLGAMEISSIPSEISYSFAGRHFRSGTRGSAPKCYKCGSVGHIRRLCTFDGPGRPSRVDSKIVEVEGGSQVGASSAVSQVGPLVCEDAKRAVIGGLSRSSGDSALGLYMGKKPLTKQVRGLLRALKGPSVGDKHSFPRKKCGKVDMVGRKQPTSNFPKNKKVKNWELKEAGCEDVKREIVVPPPCKKGRVEGFRTSSSMCFPVADLDLVPAKSPLVIGISALGKVSNVVPPLLVKVCSDEGLGSPAVPFDLPVVGEPPPPSASSENGVGPERAQAAASCVSDPGNEASFSRVVKVYSQFVSVRKSVGVFPTRIKEWISEEEAEKLLHEEASFIRSQSELFVYLEEFLQFITKPVPESDESEVMSDSEGEPEPREAVG